MLWQETEVSAAEKRPRGKGVVSCTQGSICYIARSATISRTEVLMRYQVRQLMLAGSAALLLVTIMSIVLVDLKHGWQYYFGFLELGMFGTVLILSAKPERSVFLPGAGSILVLFSCLLGVVWFLR